MKNAMLSRLLLLVCAILLSINLMVSLRRPEAAQAQGARRILPKYTYFYGQDMDALTVQINRAAADGWQMKGVTYNGVAVVVFMERQ